MHIFYEKIVVVQLYLRVIVSLIDDEQSTHSKFYKLSYQAWNGRL